MLAVVANARRAPRSALGEEKMPAPLAVSDIAERSPLADRLGGVTCRRARLLGCGRRWQLLLFGVRRLCCWQLLVLYGLRRTGIPLLTSVSR